MTDHLSTDGNFTTVVERETRSVGGNEIPMTGTPEEVYETFNRFLFAFSEMMDLNGADNVSIQEQLPEGVTMYELICEVMGGLEIIRIITEPEGYEDPEEATDYIELNDFEKSCDETWPNGRSLYFEGDDVDWPVFANTMRENGIECHSGMFFPGEGQTGLAYAICRSNDWPFGS